MAEDTYETVQFIVMLLLGALTAFALTKVFFRFFWSKVAPVKTVQAKVVDKFKNDRATRSYGRAAAATAYFVVFDCGNKRRSFKVSEFSYGGYRVGESGMLKYKGHRIVDFH